MNARLSLPMAVIIGINAMVGAGIFTVPSALQVTVGPVGLIGYFFVILSVICLALSLARMSELYPEEGAFYVYASKWLGHAGGLFASACYIVGLIVAMGLLTKITANYLSIYFPQSNPELVGALIIGAILLINLLGSFMNQVGQLILIVLTILPLFGITLLCLLHADTRNLFPLAPYGFGHIFPALKAVVFGFFGFEAIPALFTRIHEPEKNVSKAITYSIIIVGFIYLTFVSSIFLALPRELFTSADIPLAKVLLQAFPEYPFFIHILNWSIIITIIGTLNAMIMAVSSLVVSLGKRIHQEKLITASTSLIGVGLGIIASSIIFTNIDLLFSIAGVCIITAYVCALVPLLYLKKNISYTQRIIAALGIMSALVILLCALDGIFHITG